MHVRVRGGASACVWCECEFMLPLPPRQLRPPPPRRHRQLPPLPPRLSTATTTAVGYTKGYCQAPPQRNCFASRPSTKETHRVGAEAGTVNGEEPSAPGVTHHHCPVEDGIGLGSRGAESSGPHVSKAGGRGRLRRLRRLHYVMGRGG